jgi:serine/threonine protein kinase
MGQTLILHLKNGRIKKNMILPKLIFGLVVSFHSKTQVLGIVYFAMLYRTVPWKVAKETDPTYSIYISKRHPEGYGYLAFDKIPEGPRSLLYKILDPEASNRPCAIDLLKDPWLQSREQCIQYHESAPGVFVGELQTVHHVHVIDAHNLQQQAHWCHDSVNNSRSSSFDAHAFRS